MNGFGLKALEYWQVYLPQALSRIPDTETYFTQLGLQVQMRAAELMMQTAATAPVSDDYQEQQGYLNQARAMAQAQALSELAYLEPEPGREDLELPRR